MSDYPQGLQDLGKGCWAYLQPDGSWGLSNAGLITDGDATLLVDTLYDLKRTRDMLDAFCAAIPAAKQVDALVNTHANGDHCYGNGAVETAEIIATEACAAEFDDVPPQMMARMVKLAGFLRKLPGFLGKLPGPGGHAELAEFGAFFHDAFGRFEFDGIEPVPPTRTFSDRLSWTVGRKTVELIEVGPAHTRGDAIVWDPEARIVYTGDILFSNGHPIVWEGTVSNWVRACERILELDAEVVVAGHGPMTDRDGVRRLIDYLRYIEAQARARFDAGMSVMDAARDISLTAYDDWGEAERIAVNVDTLYREFRGDGKHTKPPVLMAMMARLYADRRR